jgi:hypothetical protein
MTQTSKIPTTTWGSFALRNCTFIPIFNDSKFASVILPNLPVLRLSYVLIGLYFIYGPVVRKVRKARVDERWPRAVGDDR